MTQEQFNELLRSQQGELNAVLMYQRLAKVVKRSSTTSLEGSLGAACFFVVILSLNRKPRLQ